MLNRIRRKTIREKGQGLTEYVLILAFIAGVAFMMFGGNDSLKGTLVNTVTKTNNILAGLFGEKTYSDYFHDWRKFSSQELKDLNNADDRLKADQEALKLIAGLFLGKDSTGVNLLMADYSNVYDSNKPSDSPQWLQDNVLGTNYLPVEGGDGWSDVLVPLSYKDKSLDVNKYLWLEANNNVKLITDIAGNDAEAFRKDSNKNITIADGTTIPDTIGKTISADRLFYSDGMIVQNNDSAVNRTIALKVHYNDEGYVDKVQIAAQKGKGDSAKSNWTKPTNNVADLNLTVTGTSNNPVISSVNNPSK